MAINKKGQAVFTGIMIAIIVLIMAVQFIGPIKTQVETARNSDNLNCTNPNNSVGTQMACINTDLWLFYFIGCVVAAGIGYVYLKRQG